eukprot:9205121-Alexandrium_andersonii.AAC.1
MPASSAAPELSAIVFCVVGQCLMAGVHSANADPSTHGPPSAEAPSKVGVHERADPSPLVLPREAVDGTGLQYK